MGPHLCCSCGEGITAAARLCPHCGAVALGNVVATQALSPRAAYAAAKTLAQAENLAFGPLLEALSKQGVVVSLVSRAEAEETLVRLAQAGVTAEFRPVGDLRRALGDAGPPRRRLPVRLLGVCAMGLLLAALTVAAFDVLRPHAARDPDASAGAEPGPTVRPAPANGAAPLLGPEVAALAIPATVGVRCGDAHGTGFYVTPTRIMTSRSIMCGKALVVRLPDGRELEGEVDWLSSRVNVATVRTAPVDCRPLELSDASRVRAGQTVYSVSAAAGLESSLSRGRIAHAARALDDVYFMQIDQAVNPGGIGAPLLDEHGGVIGVVAMARADTDGIGFAIPINYAFPGPFGDFPRAWDAAAWRARILGHPTDEAEAPQDEVQVATVPTGAQLLLVAAGSAAEVTPGQWQRGFASDPARHALVAMTATAGLPTVLRFHVQRGSDEPACAFVGTPEWRPAAGLVSGELDRLVTRRRIPPTPLSVGVVSLQTASGCADWGPGAVLRLIGAAEAASEVALH